MGPLLSTRLGSSACLIAVDGLRCFYAYHFCGELVKTARADAMISVNQLVNQYSCLGSSVSPSLVSLSGAWRLLLILCCLISGHFCIFPVRSGIEHFFRNNAVLLRFPSLVFEAPIWCLKNSSSRAAFPFSFRHRSAWTRCSCHARSCDVVGMSSAMSSVSAVCLLTARQCSPSSFASPFLGSPLAVPLPRPACRVGERGACGAA